MLKNSSSYKSNAGLAYLASFILFPFLTFFVSLFNVKYKPARYVIFAFFLLFGLNFTINQSSGFDSIRYVEYFNHLDITLFLYDINSYLNGTGEVKDIYFQVVALITKSFSDNYHILLLLESAVFSIFCIKTLKPFIGNACNRVSKYDWFILTIIVFSTNPIFNINGVRFWTASWITVYALLSSFTTGSKNPLLFLLITPLIHSTYIIIVGLYFVYIFFGKYQKFWFLFSIISYPLSNVCFKLIPSIFTSLPLIYQKSLSHYTDEDYINQVNSGTGFTYIENLFDFSLDILLIVIAYLCFKNRKAILSEVDNKLFHMFLILLSFINITNGIPSLSSRFKWMILPIAFYFVWINIDKKTFRQVFYLIPFFLSFHILNVLINQISKVIPSNIMYENLITQIISNI